MCIYLEESSVFLFELVVMFDLHGNGLISVNIAQFYVCRILHEKCSIETCGTQAWGGGGEKGTCMCHATDELRVHVYTRSGQTVK